MHQRLTTFKCFDNSCPAYINDFFKPTDFPKTNIGTSILEQNQTFCEKTNYNYGQKALSYLALNI